MEERWLENKRCLEECASGWKRCQLGASFFLYYGFNTPCALISHFLFIASYHSIISVPLNRRIGTKEIQRCLVDQHSSKLAHMLVIGAGEAGKLRLGFHASIGGRTDEM